MEDLTPAQLVDSGICPTCYDREHNHILYGDNSEKMLYENNDFECFLVGNPRSEGHTIISTKQHYKDMMETPDTLIQEIFIFSKKMYECFKRSI